MSKTTTFIRSALALCIASVLLTGCDDNSKINVSDENSTPNNNLPNDGNAGNNLPNDGNNGNNGNNLPGDNNTDDKVVELCTIPNAQPNFEDSYGSIDLTVSSPLFKYTGESYGNEPVKLFSDKLDPNVPQIAIPDNYEAKKNQFRSTWIATIGNLTMPKSDSPDAFKKQFEEYLDTHEQFNMNAVIFQVRPLLDAFYLSEINPISQYISSGKQGVNNWDLNTFDPLKYMVEATHARGMEYHAWFNPYRVTNTSLSTLFKGTEFESLDTSINNIPNIISALNSLGILADNNYAVMNPGDVYLFQDKLFLNPSRESVITHVAETIAEVVEKYDVDAIHFDDYFYPYKVTVNNVPVFFDTEDRSDFLNSRDPVLHPDNKEGLEAWRRDNITRLITTVKNTIDMHNQSNKTSVQFGISPFGIWEHKANNIEGSNTPTGSSQSYSNSIYADSKLWIETGLIDYIIPQIYWSLEETAAPYGELAIWWNNTIEKARNNKISDTQTQLYVGHANYKHFANSWEIDWSNPEEIPNQLRFNQTLDNIDGSVFFSYNELIKQDHTKPGIAKPERVKVRNDSIDLLTQHYTNVPALIPSKPWLDHHVTEAPTDAVFVDLAGHNTLDTISWKDTAENDSRYYVIYRGFGPAEDIFKNPANIISRVWRDKQNAFTLSFENIDKKQYTYLISALDASQNETDFVVVKASKELAEAKGFTCE